MERLAGEAKQETWSRVCIDIQQLTMHSARYRMSLMERGGTRSLHPDRVQCVALHNQGLSVEIGTEGRAADCLDTA